METKQIELSTFGKSIKHSTDMTAFIVNRGGQVYSYWKIEDNKFIEIISYLPFIINEIDFQPGKNDTFVIMDEKLDALLLYNANTS